MMKSIFMISDSQIKGYFDPRPCIGGCLVHWIVLLFPELKVLRELTLKIYVGLKRIQHLGCYISLDNHPIDYLETFPSFQTRED